MTKEIAKEGKDTRAVVTVLGKDKIGIISGVTQVLADCNVNILDISQTILQDFFTMIMVTDFSTSKMEFSIVGQKLQEKGEELGVEVRLQHEEIFNFMHRI